MITSFNFRTGRHSHQLGAVKPVYDGPELQAFYLATPEGLKNVRPTTRYVGNHPDHYIDPDGLVWPRERRDGYNGPLLPPAVALSARP